MLPDHLQPGAKVWYTAASLDRRLRHDPWSQPAMIYVQFGQTVTRAAEAA